MSNALPLLNDFQAVTYGDHPSQYVRIWLPKAADSRERASIFLVHGGFWKQNYGLDTAAGTACETLAPDLVKRGFVVVEIEYRRFEAVERHGFPEANLDVVAAVRFCAGKYDWFLRTRAVLLGMSAGGQLVLWASLELPQYLKPAVTVAIAPVADLEDAAELKLSDDGNAVQNYMHGNPEERRADYLNACCMCRAEELRQHVGNILLVTGARDVDVPPNMVRRLHAAIAQHGNSCSRRELLEFPEADHFNLMLASAPAWQEIVSKIIANLPE